MQKLLRCRKKVNNDLIDTLSNSTYDNISSINNSTHQSYSDSSFKLSSNTSSSSINEQKHNKKENHSTSLLQTSNICNKKERRDYKNYQSKFNKYVDNYIAQKKTH